MYQDTCFYSQRFSTLRVNTLRPRQNGRHFADDTFTRIFLNENVRISIKISLKFVPKGPINNNPALVQIMACAGQATSHYLNQWRLDYRRIHASLGLNELTLYKQRAKKWGQCGWLWLISKSHIDVWKYDQIKMHNSHSLYCHVRKELIINKTHHRKRCNVS